MTKILLTGFEAFGTVTENPSQLIVQHFAKVSLPGVTLITKVLPVTYTGSEKILYELMQQHQPDAILMLGVAAGRNTINLERFALNIDDTAAPDNDGECRQGIAIVPEATQALPSTLPLQKFHEALTKADIPVCYSNHAGAYICNHVFYIAQHELNRNNKNIPCGFIHVPSLETIALEQQIHAITKCLESLL